ncbi:MAG: PD40 domain-containing protein [Candidatus Eremiobacteraeota bacterium]|nr:PD40 domain-containing protein [Candidatus Eremiobacteraeota bacterium]MCW5866742.1 PD40 domain-containing protein [Candidatus Eremiobacteraeota bacterium]
MSKNFWRGAAVLSAALLAYGCGSDEQFVWTGPFPTVSPTATTTPTPTPTTGIVRESVDSSQAQGDGGTPDITANGGLIVFESFAFGANPNGAVFARDRTAQTLAIVSTDAAGVAPTVGGSVQAKVSASGQFVAFQSAAQTLVPGDTNFFIDTFRKDRSSGAIVRLSVSAGGVQGNESSANVGISADGDRVSFESLATNLVPVDTNGFEDVFLRIISTNSISLISTDSAGVQGDGDSYGAEISKDGNFVAFISEATNLVTGDTNGFRDVFLKQPATGATTLISVGLGGVPANNNSGFLGGFSDSVALSSNGRFVVFDSEASNLVAGDTNGFSDIFVRDTMTGTTRRVSVASDGTQGNGDSDFPGISGDGRFVVFQSDSTNLDGSDTNGFLDVYVYDTLNNVCKRVSWGLGFTPPNGRCGSPRISADGSRIVFASQATNLVENDTNNRQDIFSVANPLFTL